MNKGLAGKANIIFIAFASLITFALIFNAAYATVFPGDLRAVFGSSINGGNPYAAWVNLSKGDMFFTNGNQVFIDVNYTCTPPSVCNQSMVITGNFSEIGNNSIATGVYKAKGSGGSWAVYELNSTVNFTPLSDIMMSAKTIYLNATDANDSTVFNDTVNATVVLVNMSYPSSCPPASAGVRLPAVAMLTNGTLVNTTGQCISTCSADDVAQLNNTNATGSYYNLCGPVFGGSMTNFTALASTGNFSNFNFVVEIPGRVKLNFTTNVSMDTPQKAQTIFDFAMKNVMTGSKIGVNDTEFGSGNPDRPNLNLSAIITFYNVSGRLGFNGRPQIKKFATGSSTGVACPIGICSNFVWDGSNLTFGVPGFSDYGLYDLINVSLVYPTQWSTTQNVVFNYFPVFDASLSPRTAPFTETSPGFGKQTIQISQSLTAVCLTT